MIYASETWLLLGLAFLPIVASLVLFFSGREKAALLLLILGALALRLVMTVLDPFLHDWDERFHALVARNMMEYPFKPMLRVDPVLPYDYKAWCCNHIWLNKQPLFLWQMALSMKIFGIGEMALRLPSAVMGTVGVIFIHQMTKNWTSNRSMAFAAAFLYALSHHQLELISGLYALEHNDLAFAFYIGGSIWAYTGYQRNKNWKWAALAGLFSGAAILNKWLAGLLVFAGWGLVLMLFSDERSSRKHYLHLGLSVVVAALVFLPWQLYIHAAFPLESNWIREFNWQHLTKALDGHEGGPLRHFRYGLSIYGIPVLMLAMAGFYYLFRDPSIHKKTSVALLAMAGVLYLFFSLLVATKMFSYTYPAAIIVFALAGIGLAGLVEKWRPRGNLLLTCLLLVVGILALRPWTIAANRSPDNSNRNARIHNKKIYLEMKDSIINDHVILNCRPYEDVALMFYRGCNAYSWYPSEADFNKLLQEGHKVVVFRDHNGQVLPSYISGNPEVILLKKDLR